MAEHETAALADEVLWGKRAMWLLVRALGGKVTISDEEWARVPERPEMILEHADGAMRWTAREPASPVDAELDPPEMPGQLPLPGTEP